MRFSIITVTFNAEAFLRETLESIHSQEFHDFEHILWDGGSQDKTLKIARGFPVRVIEGRDLGIADAMNKAAAHAQGEILMHLHADDLFYHPHVLSEVNQLFIEKGEPNWLYGRSYQINERGQELNLPAYLPFSYKKLRAYNCISHPATFYKKEFFLEQGGFDPSLKYCMDYDLWLRFAKISTPHSVPHVFSYFRQHQGSLSTRELLGVADEAYTVRKRHLTGWVERWRSYRTWKRRRRRALEEISTQTQ